MSDDTPRSPSPRPDQAGETVPSEPETIVARVWGTTIKGHEAPGQTIRSSQELAEPRGDPATFARTISIVLPLGAAPGEEASSAETLVTGSEPPAAGTPEPSAQGGAFQILSLLGEGGMGVVYTARQDSLDREVALKVPRRDPRMPTDAESRFVEEAVVTGNLDHPNIVPVHDLGRDESGRLYMAMKLVRGTPWNALLHPRDPESGGDVERGLREHLDILLKVADAVAFAHARGIVHRDLKPENVMVGDFGEVVVMDWGLALTVGPQQAQSRRARSGARPISAGTPSYMAPELALGQMDKIGTASDLYLLGATLYELLAGTPPHRGSDVWKVLAAAARGDVEPPSQRAPERAIPRELERIALRAVAREPSDRYADVPAFQHALRTYLAHEESLRLMEEGLAALARLDEAGSVPLEQRYPCFADALAAFAQALHLWSENDEALNGQARAAQSYAEEAMDRGDLGLAATQLGLLEENPRVEPARLTALRSAITTQSASRARSHLAAAAVVTGLVVATLSVAQWRSDLESQREAAAEAKKLQGQVDAAWKAARAGDFRKLDAARIGLESSDSAALDELGSAHQWLLWATEAVLWRQNFDGLAAVLPRSRRQVASRGDEFRPGAAETCRRLLTRPEIAETSLGRQIHGVCTENVKQPWDFRLWASVLASTRAGLDADALEAVDEEWQRWRSAADLDRSNFFHTRTPVIRSGAWYLAGETARLRGDPKMAGRSETRMVPFRLSRAPFGDSVVRAASSSPRAIAQPDGSWIAFDRDGKRIWGTQQLVESEWKSPTEGIAVPVEDGSLVVAAGAQLIRLSPSGRVLGRLQLDGPVQLAWPDPADRSRLGVLVSTGPRPDATRDIRIAHVRSGEVAPWRPATGSRGPGLTPSRAPSQRSSDASRRVADELRKRLQKEAEAWFGGASGAQEAQTIERVAQELYNAAQLDPTNADLWINAVEELGSLATPEASDEIATRVGSMEGMSPARAVRVGIRLEKIGFSDQAEALYRRARASFLEHQGNPDLNLGATLSPAGSLRRFGGERFEAGDEGRALELVEVGRWFSTFMVADPRFYRRYERWLLENDRPEEAARMARRSREAQRSDFDPALGLPSRYTAAAGVAVYALFLAPWVLVLLLLRSWVGSRTARLADLQARGWRSAWQRLAAFVTHPVDRLGFSFFAYSPRTERAVIAALGAVLLVSIGLLGGGRERLEQASDSGLATNGYPGSDAMVRYLESQVEAHGDRPGVLRLLAEAHRARGDDRAARSALARAPKGALTLNNIALLDEQAGRADAARAGYEAAARLGGEAGAVAQWNLARSVSDADGLPRSLERLAHRDRLRAEHFGPDRPLWASVPVEDLLDTSRGWDSLFLASGRAVLAATFDAGPMLTRVIQLVDRPSRLTGAGETTTPNAFGYAVGYGTAIASLLALIWLPLRVRPVSARLSSESRDRNGRGFLVCFVRVMATADASAVQASALAEKLGSKRLLRPLAAALDLVATLAAGAGWLWARSRAALALIGLLLPGTWDLIAGRAVLGALVQFVFVLSYAVRNAVLTGGFFLEGRAAAANRGYFGQIPPGIAHPELAWVAHTAAAVAVVIFVANIPWTLIRARRAGAFAPRLRPAADHAERPLSSRLRWSVAFALLAAGGTVVPDYLVNLSRLGRLDQEIAAERVLAGQAQFAREAAERNRRDPVEARSASADGGPDRSLLGDLPLRAQVLRLAELPGQGVRVSELLVQADSRSRYSRRGPDGLLLISGRAGSLALVNRLGAALVERGMVESFEVRPLAAGLGREPTRVAGEPFRLSGALRLEGGPRRRR